MPMPYSHYVLAQRITEQMGFKLESDADYYLGAFLPDIRYFNRQPRERYHFAVEKLEPYVDAVSQDFLLGYAVHLLIDEVWEDPDIKQTYKNAFPRIIRSRMTRGLQALAFEVYCLNQLVKTISLKTSKNALTEDLDIDLKDLEWSVDSMTRYMAEHDLKAAYNMAKETKLFPDKRLQTVKRVIGIMKNPLIGWIVKRMIRTASTPLFPVIEHRVLDRLEGYKPMFTQHKAIQKSTTR